MTYRPNREPNYICPWCKNRPPMFGFPAGYVGGVPVLCSLCGRWSMLPADMSQPLIRADAEERKRIRLLKGAQRLRSDWRQQHVHGRDRRGESS